MLLRGIDGDVRPVAKGGAHGVHIRAGSERDEHGADLRLGKGRNAAGEARGSLDKLRLHAPEIAGGHAFASGLALEPHGLARHIKLDRHGIADGEKGQSIATGADETSGEANDFINVLPQLDAFAQSHAEGGIGDHFKVRSLDAATCDERNPSTAILRPRQALHDNAQRLPAMLTLDGVRDKAPRRGHAGHGACPILQARRYTRHLREGATSAALHDPQIRADAVHQQRGEDETARVMPDVADGEVHGFAVSIWI